MHVGSRTPTLLQELTPRLFSTLRQGYSTQTMLADLFAGLTVGIVALPLAMAFAIASNVPPERGLVTAIVAGFLISALGGSRTQIGGPTGAFVVIVYGIVEKYGIDGLLVATLMAGLMLIAMGLARMGRALKYIPYPVITGFTTGIAVIIFSSQVKDFFGLSIDKVPSEFIEKWGEYFEHAATLNYWAALIGLLSLVALVVLRRVQPKLPGALVVVIVSSAAVALWELPVETIGSRFGEIPSTIPVPAMPALSLARVRELFQPALTVALLAGIESLLSAVVADGMSGDRHNSNGELVAQGVANIASAAFGGIPATGAIARTATNIRSGAQTPVAGMVHAVFLLFAMLFLAPFAKHIPLTALAAILFLVAWNMAELHHFRYILRAPRSDAVVLLLTFLLTVLIDLTVAVQVGVVLSAFIFLRKMTEVTSVTSALAVLSAEDEEDEDLDLARVPPGIEVFELRGPFFFAVADKVKDTLQRIKSPARAFVLVMRHVPIIDASGLHALEELLSKCRRQKAELVLVAVQPVVMGKLRRVGFLNRLGDRNVHRTLGDALDAAHSETSAGPT